MYRTMREVIIEPILWHFGNLNYTYFGNFDSAEVTVHVPALQEY